MSLTIWFNVCVDKLSLCPSDTPTTSTEFWNPADDDDDDDDDSTGDDDDVAALELRLGLRLVILLLFFANWSLRAASPSDAEGGIT